MFVSQVSFCTIGEDHCVSEVNEHANDCIVSCEGLYADIEHTSGSTTSNSYVQLLPIFKNYNSQKEKIAKHMVFDPVSDSSRKWYIKQCRCGHNIYF